MAEKKDRSELERTRVYARYEFDCPECNEVPELGDADPSGEIIECGYCGRKFVASN